MKSIVLLVFLFFMGCAAYHPSAVPSGAVTSGDDMIAVKRTVDLVGLYADEQRWLELKPLFAEQVVLDYASMTGQPAETLSPDVIVNRWKTFLPGFDRTHHHMTNHDIRIQGDTAVSISTVQAIHQIKGHETWTVYGTYHHKLSRFGSGWKIEAMRLNFSFAQGNTDLPQIALDRLKK